MTADEVIRTFFSGFGLPVCEPGSRGGALPCITCRPATGGGDGLTAELWGGAGDGQRLATVAGQIAEALQDGGLCLLYDSGALWLRCDSPYAEGVLSGLPAGRLCRRLHVLASDPLARGSGR